MGTALTTNSGKSDDNANKLGRLKKRPEFLRVASGAKWGTRSALLQAKTTAHAGMQDVRLGFTATKRLGNAVTRNRAKRRLRAAAAEIFPGQGKPGFDYVLIARPGALTQPYKLLLDDIREALERVHQRTKPKGSGTRKRPDRRRSKDARP